MEVQIISFNKEGLNKNIVFSKLSTPRALDEFDLNIIDLEDEMIWYNKESKSAKTINIINDFKSIGEMVKNSSKTSIVYVFPQDIMFHWIKEWRIYDGKSKPIYTETRIKDEMAELQRNVIPSIVPNYSDITIVFENTTSKYGNYEYSAAFHFICKKEKETTILSEKSQKATMIQLKDGVYLATIDILSKEEKMTNFIATFLGVKQYNKKPDWIKGILFSDDNEQRAEIDRNEEIIRCANNKIEAAKAKLNQNDVYKSILYTNADALVKVVFSMLEKLFNYDLSGFVDKKDEDFIIKKETYTLIGEIKGVTSNVRNEHISQVEVHYQKYMDRLDEEGVEENVYQVLIINPLRNKPIFDREAIHERQIEYAKRNGCLIIETYTLLKLFERFEQNRIEMSDCERMFIEKTGLLSVSDFAPVG